MLHSLKTHKRESQLSFLKIANIYFEMLKSGLVFLHTIGLIKKLKSRMPKFNFTFMNRKGNKNLAKLRQCLTI
jgi:hypothetical protein